MLSVPVLHVEQRVVGDQGGGDGWVMGKVLSQNRLTNVVMKFQLSQNLLRNTRFTASSEIKARFNSKPRPSEGSSLKLAFRYPNTP